MRNMTHNYVSLDGNRTPVRLIGKSYCNKYGRQKQLTETQRGCRFLVDVNWLEARP